MSLTTRDALFEGRVSYEQPARGRGYRVNVDALLLAAFAAEGRRVRCAADLGAGAGAVALALLHMGAAERALLVEIDEHASRAARANLAANGWAERGTVLCADVASLGRGAAAADLVVCNPPFVAPGRGRLPAREAAARARCGELRSFTRAARVVLARRARACFVYPAAELDALFEALGESGLIPKRLRAVHASREAPARVILVEARPGKAGGLLVSPPLVERDAAGANSAELRRILSGLPLRPLRAGDRER